MHGPLEGSADSQDPDVTHTSIPKMDLSRLVHKSTIDASSSLVDYANMAMTHAEKDEGMDGAMGNV